MLELRKIKKHYNSTLVLEISLLKLEGGIYWLKGANGSGKTTLLKMIAGLLPFEGDILFKNVSLRSNPLIYRQNMSWADAEPLYPSYMTGKDLVTLYLKIRKALQEEVDNLLELFKMTEYINSAIGTYSTGMTKKLSLVLAFIGNPPLIILDEPLITLDADTFKVASNLILKKSRTIGTSFLMSSHQDLDKALSISGKELIINNRTIVMNELSF